MKLIVHQTERLEGAVTIPASKSHTIRAIILAALAEGRSRLGHPLFSDDTRAAINACRAIGARIEQTDTELIIDGVGARPHKPTAVLDMLNSGTSTNLMLGVLAALGVAAEITGDTSLRTRPVSALCDALQHLGCTITYHDRPDCPPLSICGKLRGGSVSLDAGKSSQYVSSLLIAAALAETDTEILVANPTELPYIDLTLHWLDTQSIRYTRDGYTRFCVQGRQAFRPFNKQIPADWSSAAFPLCAAAMTRSDVLIKGIDINDIQGDKAIISYLEAMGAAITSDPNGIRIKGAPLNGTALDINATPDALPALAAIGCFSNGTTKLYNVAQARVKETDRITVMANELAKLGGRIDELPDGLIIHHSRLSGAQVHGHHDHRVVMALSLAGLTAQHKTVIDTAEAIAVTYPHYIKSMQSIGANFKLQEEV
ncbi:MAG: 3-phosphoshikimate 1-carboxyvinyltransferase [Deltaproteobacteria bacterium]|nr:3-phosphoshikimate 1-carboxyvinyltransferase [Deltaproteobacteria bacterium]